MNAKHWLEKIHSLSLSRDISIMNVCGGHERTLSAAGLRSILPQHIHLIPGPGCPVCVCPEQVIQFAINLSEEDNVILTSFGDMLRVPTSKGKKSLNSLLQSRALGNQVIPIVSPLEVLNLAKQNPTQTIVFFVAGFETTLAPVVSLMEQGVPDNVKFLIAARKTWPIVKFLLDSPANRLDALIAPGHVASVMGGAEWNFISETYQTPCAIAGFNESSLLAAIYSVCRQYSEQQPFLDNCYPTVVNETGNQTAQHLMNKYFSVYNADWRGIGQVESSGFRLKPSYDHWNAEVYFNQLFAAMEAEQSQKKQDMPLGCDCDQVVLGKILPTECRLFGKACTPAKPVGPCMVSDEGACHIWSTTGVCINKPEAIYAS